MGGICGMFEGAQRPADGASRRRMNRASAHRGPDGEGYYVQGGVGLAMRRLAIIDVAGGDQPIFNEDKTIAIMYNGECYNYQELRESLDKKKHSFRTNSDTECVVHLYEDLGDECVQPLRGMFAFAIWDENRQRLLIARDRLGKKPLHYAVMDGRLYFASELKALLSALPRQPELNLQTIDDYLSLQYIPEPNTVYKDVYKLPAGHRLIWEHGRLKIESYWNFTYDPKHTASEGELVEELRSLARDAVRMRLISEAPLGVHLSGGIDSSIVVAL